MSARVLLVGCTGGAPSTGAGACIARTRRFGMALESAGFEVVTLSPPEGRRGARAVGRALDEASFDCAVLISPFPAEAAALGRPGLPLWVDMNGMHPAEMLLRSTDSGRAAEHMLRILALENLLLRTCDRFSCPSRRQADALMGELLLLGRLDSSAAGTVPVSAIPHCAMPGAPFREEEAIRGPSGVNVLSAGAFNVWFDHLTLFAALETAMSREPSITFTCAGGAVPFSPGSYLEFEEMARSSRFADRFRLLGWLDEKALEEVYENATMAVYADLPGAETRLGARTRVLDWVSRGIPVVCTLGAEISEDIRDGGLGIVVPQGDPEALTEALIRLASSRELAREIRSRQRAWCEGPGSMDRVFEPLVSWCSSPSRLPQGALARPTAHRLDSPGYLAAIFRVVAREQGVPRALYRLLEKLVPVLKRLRKPGRG
ncbi:glycosyltransferase [Candidatus Fermentibacterales bacterium]|nr:glycosyltransferase [Candidatus Fermentibacterales bacterium]